MSQLVRYVPEDVKAAEDKTREILVKTEGEHSKMKEEFSKLKERALQKVENLDIPKGKKNKLREIIEKTQILPPKVVNDPSYGVWEVVQVVEPEVFTKHPAGRKMFEAGFELADAARSGRKIYCYLIGNKPVEIVDGTLKGRKRLGELDLEALRLIFGDEHEEEET